MNQNDLLGVCIPAYKRPEQLALTLRSIISSGSMHRIPIFIADDSCDDTNVEVVTRLSESYPFIHHFRNETNLGIDRNIRRCAELCTSRYAWMLGEDDRIAPGGLERMLDVLRNTNSSYSYYYVNYASIDEDVTFVLHKRSLPLHEDMVMSTSEFFQKYAWSMGFIGACVVKSETWMKTSPDPYFGTFYAHVGVIMEMCRNEDIYLVSDALVWNRCGTPRTFTWSDSAFSVLNGWEMLCGRLSQYFGPAACDTSVTHFEDAHGLRSLKLLCYLRADGAFGPAVLRESLKPFSRSPGYRFGAWLIAHTPPIVFRMARWCLMAKRKMVAQRVQDIWMTPDEERL